MTLQGERVAVVSLTMISGHLRYNGKNVDLTELLKKLHNCRSKLIMEVIKTPEK
jgi:hypothetical protein